MTHLNVYQRTDDRWAWRLVADNGDVIATDAGQGYENRGDCEAMAVDVVAGRHRPRREGPTVIVSKHVDVVIAHGEADSLPVPVADQDPEHADVAPDPTWRIVLLSRTKQEGMAEAAQRGFTPAAIVTPRALDAAHGITADEIVVSAALTDEQRDLLMPHATPAADTI